MNLKHQKHPPRPAIKCQKRHLIYSAALAQLRGKSRRLGLLEFWVATGRNTQDLAKGDALANCQADTGGECVVAQYGADTTLIVYTADGKSLAVTQDSDLDRAQNMVRFICLREKQACKVQAVVNSEVEETSVYNIAL